MVACRERFAHLDFRQSLTIAVGSKDEIKPGFKLLVRARERPIGVFLVAEYDQLQDCFGDTHEHGHLLVNFGALGALRHFLAVAHRNLNGGIERFHLERLFRLLHLEISSDDAFASTGRAEQQLDARLRGQEIGQNELTCPGIAEGPQNSEMIQNGGRVP